MLKKYSTLLFSMFKLRLMISVQELKSLLSDLESDRVERTITKKNINKFCQAICAFSNDMPDHKRPGYLLVGVDDDGTISGEVDITDELLLDLASQRDNGTILPVPSMTVQKMTIDNKEIAVVEVLPHPIPPIKYRGKIYIRIGPRKGIANQAEERILIERSNRALRTYDSSPCLGSTLKDLNLDIFQTSYLPLAVDEQILKENNRDVKLQLS
ncbi:MAG: RNA-binding domain-containing protein, partial [Bacteroidota bacterium]